MRYFDARDVRVRRPVSRLAKERRQALCAALNEHQAKQIQARADLIALGIAPERAPWRRMQVSIFRGSTASSTSAAITPVQILPQTSPAPCVAGSSVTGPSSGLVSTASATLIHTDSWSAAFQSYMYFQDDPAMRARCDVSQRLHVRLCAPSTALAIVGTATIQQEIGRLTNV